MIIKSSIIEIILKKMENFIRSETIVSNGHRK